MINNEFTKRSCELFNIKKSRIAGKSITPKELIEEYLEETEALEKFLEKFKMTKEFENFKSILKILEQPEAIEEIIKQSKEGRNFILKLIRKAGGVKRYLEQFNEAKELKKTKLILKSKEQPLDVDQVLEEIQLLEKIALANTEQPEVIIKIAEQI